MESDLTKSVKLARPEAQRVMDGLDDSRVRRVAVDLLCVALAANLMVGREDTAEDVLALTLRVAERERSK